MSEHPLHSMVEGIVDSLAEMANVTTIIGDPIVSPTGTTIIPVSMVTISFGIGGANMKGKPVDSQDRSPFGGGGAGSVSIVPVAFLTVTGENVKLITIDRDETTLDKALALLPELVDKLATVCKKVEKSFVQKGVQTPDAPTDADPV